jgi:uracil-DNA glycosylase
MVSPKPQACLGCTLYTRGAGFAYPAGPSESPIIFVGEALGKTEAMKSTPFVGEAGVYLNRAFSRLGINRSQIRIANVVSCQPPNDWLAGAPWEQAATSHCRTHRDAFYSEKHAVYVTMGVTSTRVVLKEVLGIDYHGKLDNWHGYVLGSGPYVIPTYHPAYLLRGNHKLFGVLVHDIKRAMEVASFGKPPYIAPHLAVDPPIEWFTQYVDEFCRDPGWLAVDIETPMKGEDESDIETPLISPILRINFSYNRDEGVTVPWKDPYLFGVRRLLSAKCAKLLWNERFDIPILHAAGMPVTGPILDGMWAWHLLQSDLPKGLGFVAPFYSDMPPWKHLSSEDPGTYAAIDGVQQYRLMTGIATDLVKEGMWDSFMEYAVKFDTIGLHPMENEGLLLDPAKIKVLQEEISAERVKLAAKIQQMVPPEVQPWAGGWKRQPDPQKWPGAVLRKVKETVLVCTDCGEAEVGPAHKCKKG